MVYNRKMGRSQGVDGIRTECSASNRSPRTPIRYGSQAICLRWLEIWQIMGWLWAAAGSQPDADRSCQIVQSCSRMDGGMINEGAALERVHCPWLWALVFNRRLL